MPLFGGDTVETRKGQKAALAFCDGGNLYLNQGTTAQMRSRNSTEVRRGEVAAKLKAGTSHEARAPSAEARAHGSYFDVKVEQRRSTFIVVTGTLQVQNRFGKVRVRANRETIVPQNRPPQKPVSVNAQQATDWTSPLSEHWQILTASGILQGPIRLALDSQGNIYVTDVGNTDSRVVKLSPSGQQLAAWHLQGSVPQPWGIELDKQNDVYVTDDIEGTIQKFSSTGQPLATFGQAGSGPGQFILPYGIDVDPAGNIYVADSGNNRIQKLSPIGQPLAQFGTKGTTPGQFDSPNDLALDSQGNIYVADWSNERIQKLSPTGQPLLAWGSFGDAPGQFRLPADVALDSQGNVYVADEQGSRVKEFSSSGQVLHIWQNDPLKSLKDPGQFDRVYGVAVDAKGNIYVADHYNARIQKLVRS
jgi:streptogramin lyase